MGAALCWPSNLGDASAAFLPLLVSAIKLGGSDFDSDILLQIEPITHDFTETGSIGIGDVLTCVVLDQIRVLGVEFAEPTMAMGTSPAVICCCHENTIVAAVRRKGLVAAYQFADSSLEFVGQKHVNQYIVDAAIRPGEVEGEKEIVLLLSDPENPKDGRAATISLSQIGGVC